MDANTINNQKRRRASLKTWRLAEGKDKHTNT